MISLQPFFLLFILFDSLISFSFAVNSGKQDSQASTSHVIHLNSDLLSLVHHRLPLATLSLFPKGYVTKENFRVCLENWLDQLKEWNGDELGTFNVVNKIAQTLGLIGNDQKTSLELSDPPDNTKPASWAEGLSIVLIQVNMQLNKQQKPTLLMPWIFIPDSQAFHFTLVYRKVYAMQFSLSSMFLKPDYPKSLIKVLQLLLPAKDTHFMNEIARLDAAYVRHNRDVDPKKKSQVNDLTEYYKYDGGLFIIWGALIRYPWLRNYVKFGRSALKLLLEDYETQHKYSNSNGDEKMKNEAEVWLLQEQLKNDGK